MNRTVDYQESPISGDVGELYVAMLPVAMFSATVIGVLLFVVVPRFRDVFSDFKTDLPMMTDWLIRAAHQRQLCVLALVLVTPALPLISLPAMLTARRRSKRAAVVRGAWLQMTVLVAVVVFGFVVPLVLPLIKIMQAVHGRP